MARPRKPTAIKELNGAYKKDPQRRPENEPQPSGPLGEPPKYFTKRRKDIWREIELNAAEGVLTISDRLAVEMLTNLVYKQRYAADDFKASDGALLAKMLSQLGMTPADRSKIVVPKKPEVNPFSDFH